MTFRAVLDGGDDPGGERGTGGGATARAPFLTSPVLSDGERGFRDVHHLPFPDTGQGDAREAPAASATNGDIQDFHGIRRFVREEGASFVTGPAAPLSAGLLPQGKIRLWFSVSPGRGRFAGIGAVHAQPALSLQAKIRCNFPIVCMRHQARRLLCSGVDSTSMRQRWLMPHAYDGKV